MSNTLTNIDAILHYVNSFLILILHFVKMTGEEFKTFIKRTGLTQEEAADIIGITRQTLHNKFKLGLVEEGFLQNVKNRLLVSGVSVAEPRVQYGANNAKPTHLKGMENINVMVVPMVDQRAHAGYLSGFADPDYEEELPKVAFMVPDREFKGKYLSFEVVGDSMDNGSSDSYLQGDKLLCREVQRHLWQGKLHYKKYDFVIVHREMGILIKRIIDHDVERGVITLHSLNELYQDFTVSLDDVAQLFNVIQINRDKR